MKKSSIVRLMQIRNKETWLLIIIFLALFISVFAGSDALAKKKVVCEYCGEGINGQYVLIDGYYYHPVHFKCSNCGTPIGHTTYHKKDGKYFCEKCFDRLFARRCTFCGGVIDQGGIIVGGFNYHEKCYNENIAKHCAVCGEIIFDDFYLDYWGNAYHKKHLDSLHQCRYCGRLISDKTTNGGLVYDDGRYVCNLCRRQAVNDPSTALSLLDTALIFLKAEGIDIRAENINFYLVDRDDLTNISGQDIEMQEGYTICNETSIGSDIVERRIDIYTLGGKPREHFIGDVAHELMHCWLCSNAPKNIASALAEGSCNYASFLALKHLSEPYAGYIISNLNINNDPDYGEGFRRVRKLVENNGVEYWLYHLKQNKDFPSGY